MLTSYIKEKTFADDIVLSFPKEKLTVQQFNEDGNEEGSNLIYFGKFSSKIEVKYFKNIMPEPPPPPPPPPEGNENTEEYLEAQKQLENSVHFENKSFFRTEKINFFDTNEDLYEFINDQSVQIIVKQKDTIPLYKRDYQTKVIKKHKAYPVFIKNISSKTLKIPVEAKSVALYVQNNDQCQFVRNSNYTLFDCLVPLEVQYFELKPNEILIYSFPHLQKGQKRKAKISFYKAQSEEFEISIDEEIIKKQRTHSYLK